MANGRRSRWPASLATLCGRTPPVSPPPLPRVIQSGSEGSLRGRSVVTERTVRVAARPLRDSSLPLRMTPFGAPARDGAEGLLRETEGRAEREEAEYPIANKE